MADYYQIPSAFSQGPVTKMGQCLRAPMPNLITNCLEICTTPIGIGVSVLGLGEEPFGGFSWDDRDYGYYKRKIRKCRMQKQKKIVV
jgi:hypothetical protein